MREIRRDIARVKTVLRQKESQASGRAQAGSGR